MKKYNHTTTMTLPEIFNEDPLQVEVEFIIDNDGIGPYEFWGAKSYDNGVDFIVIEDITPDWTRNDIKYTTEDKNLIEKYITDNFKELTRELEQNIYNEN